MRDRPFALFGAAGGLAVQAAGLCAASVLAAIDTADGQSYQRGSGIALTVIGFATVAAVGSVVVGVVQQRRWSWTPAILIQLFTLIVGIYLLQSDRYNWGVPAVLLAVVVAVLLLLPSSLDALGRKPPPAAEDQPAATGTRPTKTAATKTAAVKTAAAKTTAAKTAAARPAKTPAGGNRPSRPRSGRP